MTKKSLLLLTVFLAALPLFASSPAPGTILKSIPVTLKAPTGLTWDGSHLWVADLESGTLNKIDPASGKILKTVNAPGYFPMGLAWDGRKLWVVDKADKTAYAYDPASGTTLSALPLDAAFPEGVGWDGKALWVDDARTGVIARLDDSDGSTYKSISSPTAHGRRSEEIGLAFDGDYLYVSDRMANKIYRLDAKSGDVLDSFPSPGPYPAGLAWDGKHLWNIDYETRKLYELSVDRTSPYVRSDKKRERLTYTESWRNFGPGVVQTLDVYVAVPVTLPNQELLGQPVFNPAPAGFVTDKWGQKCAHYHFADVEAGSIVSATMTVNVDLYKVRWFIDPDKVGSLDDIPTAIRAKYTRDDTKLAINDPVIQKALKSAVGNEKNPYWIARKINRYIQKKMHYEMVGGWNTAPTVLSRGSGSCSEYTFVMLAMCHAAGLPARYNGSVVIRGDDASRDDVFHRWVEVYLPNYGWVPVDPSGGDSDVPATRASYFGGLNNRFLITTIGAGGSKTLGWDYNSDAHWTAKGRVKLMQLKAGDWAPIGKKYEAPPERFTGSITRGVGSR